MNFLGKIIPIPFIILSLIGCASSPQLDQNLIRPWSSKIGDEFPHKAAALVLYKKGPYELYYLAAHHENTISGETLSLVSKLFNEYKFDVLIIEPFAFSYGKSPAWYVEESKKGINGDFILGGESAWAVFLADKKGVPFFGGEPDHSEIYKALKNLGYTDEDVLGFYLVRQIPEWFREKESPQGLLERKGPNFIAFYCKTLAIKKCPTVSDLKKWYNQKVGKELVPEVSNEETAPYDDGKLFTHQISSAVSKIRNSYTLNRIEQLLRDYKKVAVIYGAGHFINLRKSFDSAFGEPIVLSNIERFQ